MENPPVDSGEGIAKYNKSAPGCYGALFFVGSWGEYHPDGSHCGCGPHQRQQTEAQRGLTVNPYASCYADEIFMASYYHANDGQSLLEEQSVFLGMFSRYAPFPKEHRELPVRFLPLCMAPTLQRIEQGVLMLNL